MTMLTQPLREEHQELLPQLEQLRTVADSVGETSVAALQQGVDGVYAFLTHHLLPHAQAEEQALYPVVGKLMGAAQATATMSRDHLEVSRLTAVLGTLRAELRGPTLEAAQAQALRRVLYGLYTLIQVHFAKEEEVYLPLLDTRLTAEDAHRLFEAMEMAAQGAKRALGQ